jgi:hypothetical protein
MVTLSTELREVVTAVLALIRRDHAPVADRVVERHPRGALRRLA